eukprot:s1_g2472.t1
MDLALAHPKYGYYRTRDPLGAKGDFTTAPEISQMFGELLGLWAVDMWQKLGSPAAFNLIEFGPGRGTLMADAIRAAKLVPAFCQAATIVFMETSPALRAEQKKRVPEAVWIDSVETLPAGPSLILANEFFDALPIKQFEKTESGWRERCITLAPPDVGSAVAFQYCLAETPTDPSLIPGEVRDAAEGSISETCPLGQEIMGQVCHHLDAHSGAALIIDYGHAHSAAGDTFQALQDHKFADPLAEPGDADLTAHVDFQALAERASPNSVYGPTTQGAFLEALGIEARAAALTAKATERQSQDIKAALKRLTDPDAMGSLFKGGTSSGIYAGRNCGLGSDDLRANVIENRGQTADELGVPRDHLLTVYQVHSPQVIVATKPWSHDEAPEGDAIVTATPGLALGILTADCTPVLFAEPEAGVIGAAHAGWKGAIGGVLEATVNAMTSLGAERERIDCSIGPTISQANYEVGPEFQKHFVDEAPGNGRFFVSSARENHFQFDLPGFVSDRLGRLGLHKIDDTKLCTYADAKRFFSFRRTTHAGEPDYGRQISSIALKSA